MRKAAVLVVLMLGCDSGEEGGPCADRTGLYQSDMVAEWGDCPSPISQIVNIDGAPMGGKCTGSVVPSADNCSVTQDQTCVLDTGATAKMTGKTEWNADGSRGGGKVSVTITLPGGDSCNGLYRQTLRRL